MPLHKLNTVAVKNLKTPGRHSDGGNLYLNVTKTGARSWVFFYRREGKLRELGLGSAQTITLAAARDKAKAAREAVAVGDDPKHASKKIDAPTFGECADAFIKTMEPSWRNAKHAAQWKMTLKHYAGPIRAIPIAEVATADVLKILSPIWSTKPETASRLRGRIESVLDAANAQGLRSGDNPATWRGHLAAILPKRASSVAGIMRPWRLMTCPAL